MINYNTTRITIEQNHKCGSDKGSFRVNVDKYQRLIREFNYSYHIKSNITYVLVSLVS